MKILIHYFILSILWILGFYHKLGPRIYPEGPKPYDSNKWLQCYNCGEITPKVLAKQLNKIAPIVDPPDNIHDSNKVVVLATHKRTKLKIQYLKR